MASVARAGAQAHARAPFQTHWYRQPLATEALNGRRPRRRPRALQGRRRCRGRGRSGGAASHGAQHALLACGVAQRQVHMQRPFEVAAHLRGGGERGGCARTPVHIAGHTRRGCAGAPRHTCRRVVGRRASSQRRATGTGPNPRASTAVTNADRRVSCSSTCKRGRTTKKTEACTAPHGSASRTATPNTHPPTPSARTSGGVAGSLSVRDSHLRPPPHARRRASLPPGPARSRSVAHACRDDPRCRPRLLHPRRGRRRRAAALHTSVGAHAQRSSPCHCPRDRGWSCRGPATRRAPAAEANAQSQMRFRHTYECNMHTHSLQQGARDLLLAAVRTGLRVRTLNDVAAQQRRAHPCHSGAKTVCVRACARANERREEDKQAAEREQDKET